MSLAQSVLGNALLSTGAQVAGRLLRFAIVSAFVVRLGAEAWGQVAYIFALLSYALLFLDLGFATSSHIDRVRDVSVDAQYAFVLVGLRALVVCMAIPFAVWNGVGGLGLLGLGLCLTKVLFPDWYFVRKTRSGVVQLLLLLKQAVVAVLFWSLPTGDVTAFLVWEIISDVVMLVVAWVLVPRELFSWGSMSFRPLWRMLRGSLTLFVASLCLLMHQSIDILALKYWHTLDIVGVYDYATKLMAFAFFAGGSLTVALRSRLAADGEARSLDGLVVSSQYLLSVLSLGFIWVVCFLLPHLLPAVLGQGAHLAQQVLLVHSLYLLLAFLAIPMTEWLLVSQSRRLFLLLALVGGGVDVLSNILLTPWLGALGAALSKALAEGGILAFLFWRLGTQLWSAEWLGVQSLIGATSAVLFGVWWIFGTTVWSALLGIFVILAALWLIRSPLAQGARRLLRS